MIDPDAPAADMTIRTRLAADLLPSIVIRFPVDTDRDPAFATVRAVELADNLIEALNVEPEPVEPHPITEPSGG